MALWSGLSLHHALSGLGAARLVSTPSAISCGLARDYQLKGFPEFEQFYISDFSLSTQFGFKSVASTIPPRPLSERGYRQEDCVRQATYHASAMFYTAALYDAFDAVGTGLEEGDGTYSGYSGPRENL